MIVSRLLKRVVPPHYTWFVMAEESERRKVVVVGDSETGKTSLLYRVTNPDKELPQFPPTILENQVIK